jgi:hypothetical protein
MKIDESRLLSEQDYGPFLEVATLTEEEGKLVLSVSAGYGQEKTNETAWYELSARPSQSLDEYASPGWLDPVRNQAEEFAELFLVSVVTVGEYRVL